MKQSTIILMALGFLFVCFLVSPCLASSNVLFILDGSNSMWGQVDGVPKIATAKQVLAGLLQELPQGTNVGVMAYGHRSEGDCKDVELLAPIGSNDPNKLAKSIETIQPKGKTPLTYSLEQSLPLFASLKGESNSVVLVSDGKETCGGDPCQAAKKLAAAGVGLKVHVVGFDVSAEERKQLECIAAEGKGRYFHAKNTEGFKEAFAQVKAEVTQPTPEPKEPKLKEYFFDGFDGNKLKAHWEVVNPNPDAFIVENGALTVVFASDTPFFGDNTLENIFRLTKPLPEGDWTVTMRLIPHTQTFRERFHLALYDDKDNMLAATTMMHVICCGYSSVVSLGGTKIAAGKKTDFGTQVLVSENLGNFRSGTEQAQTFIDWNHDNVKAINMRLQKRGRDYIAAAKVEGVTTGEKPEWVEVQKLTSLRLPGKSLVIVFHQTKYENPNYQVEGGESTVDVDWVKIEVPAGK